MPQTTFVVGKALKIACGPSWRSIRSTARRPRHRVINEVFDLFAALDATDEQLDFPILYGSARWAGWRKARKARKKTWPRSSTWCLRHVPAPTVEEGSFRMLGTLLEANPYLGRLVTGRVFAGSVKPNQSVKVLDRKGNVVENGPGVENPRLPRH